jgi:hypothetical protein
MLLFFTDDFKYLPVTLTTHFRDHVTKLNKRPAANTRL